MLAEFSMFQFTKMHASSERCNLIRCIHTVCSNVFHYVQCNTTILSLNTEPLELKYEKKGELSFVMLLHSQNLSGSNLNMLPHSQCLFTQCKLVKLFLLQSTGVFFTFILTNLNSDSYCTTLCMMCHAFTTY